MEPDGIYNRLCFLLQYIYVLCSNTFSYCLTTFHVTWFVLSLLCNYFISPIVFYFPLSHFIVLRLRISKLPWYLILCTQPSYTHWDTTYIKLTVTISTLSDIYHPEPLILLPASISNRTSAIQLPSTLCHRPSRLYPIAIDLPSYSMGRNCQDKYAWHLFIQFLDFKAMWVSFVAMFQRSPCTSQRQPFNPSRTSLY